MCEDQGTPSILVCAPHAGAATCLPMSATCAPVAPCAPPQVDLAAHIEDEGAARKQVLQVRSHGLRFGLGLGLVLQVRSHGLRAQHSGLGMQAN